MYNIISFQTYDEPDAYGYPVEQYLKGITICANGKFDIELTEDPEDAYRFNDLITHEIEAHDNIFNLCKKNFANLQPKIKKLNITIE